MSIHEDVGLNPGLAQWGWGSSIAVSCGVGCKRGSDLVWLWLWCRLGAVALIGPLACEPPHAAGMEREKFVCVYVKLIARSSHHGSVVTNAAGIHGFDPWPHSVG